MLKALIVIMLKVLRWIYLDYTLTQSQGLQSCILPTRLNPYNFTVLFKEE